MLFYAHSGLRYLVLFAGILVLGYAVYGQATKREYDKTMRILAAVFTGSIDLTVLFGVAHLMSSVFYPQLSGHIASMVLAGDETPPNRGADVHAPHRQHIDRAGAHRDRHHGDRSPDRRLIARDDV